jgi:hypothetical protein
MKYTYSGAKCWKPLGSFENGTLKGSVTLKGTNEAGTYGLGAYMANEQVKEPPQFKAEKFPLIAGATTSATVSVRSFPLFECPTTELWGASETATSQLTATPIFGGCSVAGAGFKVESNGCQFKLTPGEGVAPGTASMSLACPGAPLTFSRAGCLIKFSSQEWPNSAHFENTGSGQSRAVSWEAGLTGSEYEEKSCPGGVDGSFSNGSIKATWLLEGEDPNGVQQGLWIE